MKNLMQFTHSSVAVLKEAEVIFQRAIYDISFVKLDSKINFESSWLIEWWWIDHNESDFSYLELWILIDFKSFN